jgi:hypothetical protein
MTMDSTSHLEGRDELARSRVARMQLECPACGCRLWHVYLLDGIHQLQCRGCGGEVGVGMRSAGDD